MDLYKLRLIWSVSRLDEAQEYTIQDWTHEDGILHIITPEGNHVYVSLDHYSAVEIKKIDGAEK